VKAHSETTGQHMKTFDEFEAEKLAKEAQE